MNPRHSQRVMSVCVCVCVCVCVSVGNHYNRTPLNYWIRFRKFVCEKSSEFGSIVGAVRPTCATLLHHIFVIVCVGMQSSYACHHSFVRVKTRISMCTMTHLYVQHASFTCAT